jgi:hypothetical protein
MKEEGKGGPSCSWYVGIRVKALAELTMRGDDPNDSLKVSGGCIDLAWLVRVVNSHVS